LGAIYEFKKQYAQAITEIERTIALDPNYADSHWRMGEILIAVGRPEEAIGWIEKAMRLNPRYPGYYLHTLGAAYVLAGRYEEALAALQGALSRNPNYLPVHRDLAVVYSELGRTTEAQAEAAEVLRTNPNFSVEVARQRLPFKDPAALERYFAGLRKAGLQ
jgi:adenylate cyclase